LHRFAYIRNPQRLALFSKRDAIGVTSHGVAFASIVLGAISHCYCCAYCCSASRPGCRQRRYRCHHAGHTADGVGVLIGEKMPVGVHRQRDAAMPHDGLDDVRLNALQGQP
jgi:hypothetical protein